MAAFVSWDPQSLSALSKRKLSALKKYGLSTAEEYQRISEQMTPKENALAFQQLQQYAPEFSRLGSQLQGQEQRAGISNDLAALLGPGQELVGSALGLDQLVNPQFYGMRDQAYSGLSALLAAQDPARLSGSELAETERGLNRMNSARGNINVTNATTTAANAGAFGSALAGKQQRFAQALNLIPALSASSRAPIDSFGIATGKGNAAPTVNSQNISTGSQAGQGFGQQLGDLQGQYMQSKSGAKSITDTVEQGVGSVCGCYIFKEHYGYPDVPDYIRWCRDFFYQQAPERARGYRRMAYWVVPLMQKYRIVRFAMTWGCIFPLSYYGEYLVGLSKTKWIFKPVAKFWLTVWKYLGK